MALSTTVVQREFRLRPFIVAIALLVIVSILQVKPFLGTVTEFERTSVKDKPSTSIQKHKLTNMNDDGFDFDFESNEDNINVRSSPVAAPNATSTATDALNIDAIQPPYTIQWEGRSSMQQIIQRFWKGNLFCETIDQTRQDHNDSQLPILVNISLGCLELFQKSDLGTGNFISLLYAMRLAASVYDNVGFTFTCDDAQESKKDLILPWITGLFPQPRSLSSTTNQFNLSLSHVCGNYDVAPVAYMCKEIQRDLRRMAIALVGVPSANHPSANFVKEYRKQRSSSTDEPQPFHAMEMDEIPLYGANEFQRDDALIHFRCGDLMNSNHPSFGFMTFSGYVRHVSPEARSIGILTQPFEDSEHSRGNDNGPTTRNRCRTAVMSLVEYINDRYPLATVRIHNNPDETIALTYARMIMANQTIVGISSFGVFPAIATFGTGYLRRPDYRKAPNKWLLDPPIDQIADNVVLFDEPKRIMAGDMKRLWQSDGEEGVLKWFWNDEGRINTEGKSLQA
jgi:hypothetical protein